MPSIKDTKRRIVSVKNTQKITKAMKLVSAAKFARANQAVLKARAYTEAFEQMVHRVIASSEVSSPLLEKRKRKKSVLIVIGTDRGMCGGLNSNIFRKVDRFLTHEKSEGIHIQLFLWGRRTFLLSGKAPVIKRIDKVLEKSSLEFAEQEAAKLTSLFLEGEVDEIQIAYPRFVNAISQKPQIERLLPISPESILPVEAIENSSGYLFEPDQDELVQELLRKGVVLKLYSIMLHSAASEHAARMTAMDSATSNAQEVIKTLTLAYNRARQAGITKELIEITSGAEAL
jgi:F-type H+-transporting ATPase subunit gamma